jgi:hypothetical protein
LESNFETFFLKFRQNRFFPDPEWVGEIIYFFTGNFFQLFGWLIYLCNPIINRPGGYFTIFSDDFKFRIVGVFVNPVMIPGVASNYVAFVR